VPSKRHASSLDHIQTNTNTRHNKTIRNQPQKTNKTRTKSKHKTVKIPIYINAITDESLFQKGTDAQLTKQLAKFKSNREFISLIASSRADD
jgi:hypothetical protein